MAREVALRGWPASSTSTRTLARPSTSAALSPAGPAPTMTTSKDAALDRVIGAHHSPREEPADATSPRTETVATC